MNHTMLTYHATTDAILDMIMDVTRALGVYVIRSRGCSGIVYFGFNEEDEWVWTEQSKAHRFYGPQGKQIAKMVAAHLDRITDSEPNDPVRVVKLKPKTKAAKNV